MTERKNRWIDLIEAERRIAQMTQGTEEIIAKAGGGSNIPAHPDGQHAAICIDIVDLGLVEMTWQGKTKKKHRIILRFFCGEWFEGDKGTSPLWLDQYLTLSLHENSTMRPFLEQWRGQKFTEAELEGFNIARLLHVPAFVQVSWNRTPEKTYANIDTIMRLPKGMEAPTVPEGYLRVKDRPKEEGDEPSHPGRPEFDDSDLPF